MFKVPTVFVIGAGAGFDIEMCLGATLMKEIARDVNFEFKNSWELAQGSPALAHAIKMYAKRHHVDPNDLYAAGRSIATGVGYAGSIDNYIHNHRSNEAIKTVGKMAIIKNIIAYEKKSKVFIDTTKHPRRFRDPSGIAQSWMHSFFKLVGDGIIVGSTLGTIFDNIAVVTFNYDRCLEQFLWQALQERFGIKPDYAARLIKKLDIIHAYGRIAPLSWEASEGAVDLAEASTEKTWMWPLCLKTFARTTRKSATKHRSKSFIRSYCGRRMWCSSDSISIPKTSS